MSSGAKFAAWICILLAAISAMLISFSGLASLARITGFGQVSPLLPIAIDVTITGATLVWLAQGAPAGAHSYARWLALMSILVSVLANATFHGLVGGERWWLASAVAAIPPAFLAALVHLGALLVRAPVVPGELDIAEDVVAEFLAAPASPAGELTNAGRQDTYEPTSPPASDDEPVTSPAPVVARPGADLADRARQLVNEAKAAGLKMGRAKLAGELGITPHRARQLLDAMPASSPVKLAIVHQDAR